MIWPTPPIISLFNVTAKKRSPIWVGLLILVAAAVLAACSTPSPTEQVTPCPEPEPCPDCPQASCPDCPQCTEPDPFFVPFEAEWASSPHNDLQAAAFHHWDGDDPAEIPVDCAKCHSTPGYMAFIGAEGSQFGTVESPAPIGTTIECAACHNPATLEHDRVVFPSGLELADLGDQATCLDCHQGLSSKVSLDEIIADVVGEDLDVVSENLVFISIHYSAAAATRYGTEVKGGYQYAGLAYDPRFDHVQGYQSCIDCHDMHTLQLKVAECTDCHSVGASLEDIGEIRSLGSMNDYDGDGDLEESVRDEIAGLQQLLYQNIQAYAVEVIGTPIVYDPNRYPFFFVDSNANGTLDERESQVANQFNAWTGRLLQAAYNYQFSQSDQGAFAHGGKYIIQLLYDSSADLNNQITNPVDMTTLHRDDVGHFAASNETWRYWDEGGWVAASCSKCHSAEGLPASLSTAGDPYPQPVASGMNCATCHDDLVTFTRYLAEQVEFPSGSMVSFENPEANLCLTCHQGYLSTPTIAEVIATSGVGDDEVSEKLSLSDPHFFAPGVTLFGTEVQGGYEYPGQTYNGRFSHVRGFQDCLECHDTHQLEVKVASCSTCHGNQSAEDLHDVRLIAGDFDGDGDEIEGLYYEITTLQQALYEAVVAYAEEVAGAPLAFDPSTYPFWFVDANRNGVVDPHETSNENRYNTWTPRLMRAVYNYTWAVKDPGAYTHNGLYMLQLLYDSLGDIGGDVSGMTRPPTTQ